MDKRTNKKIVTKRTTSTTDNAPQNLSYTFEESLIYVIKVKRANNLKERTIAGYVQNMNYFFGWIVERYGHIAIHEVTASMVRDYILWCAQEKTYNEGHPYKSEFQKDRRGIEPSSVNVRIRVLKTFFNVLVSEEVLSSSPALNVSLMRQDVDTVMPLSTDDLNRFLKAPDKSLWAQWRDYVIMTLILDCGMRLGEVCSLEKSEIDYLKKQITLPATKTKNRKSRTLPLSNETVRLLNQLSKESELHFDTSYVFTTNYGEQLSGKTVQKAFDKYANKARLNRTVSPHVLRHNFATMAAESGMSIFHLQKILGHADIATTRKYVQISEVSLADEHRLHSPLARLKQRERGTTV